MLYNFAVRHLRRKTPDHNLNFENIPESRIEASCICKMLVITQNIFTPTPLHFQPCVFKFPDTQSISNCQYGKHDEYSCRESNLRFINIRQVFRSWAE